MAKTKRFATPMIFAIVTAILTMLLSFAFTACDIPVAYRIRFYGEDGELVTRAQYRYEGEEIVVPEMPEKFGYEFAGWTLNGELYDFEADGADKATKSADFHAKYERLPDKFFVNFLLEDGTAFIEEQIVAIGNEVILPESDPTDASGKNFEGWKESGKTELYDFTNKYIVKDTTFVAVFGHSYGEWKVTTKPTCTEQGEETRVCIYNADHTETRPASALGHTPAKAVVENKVEATCETAGSYDEVVYCSVCNVQLSSTPKTVSATGHLWSEPTYTWAEDNKTCTALRVCKNDKNHTETETVNATATVTQSKACEKDELTKYVATFTNSAFTEQTKENVKTADKLGHDLIHHDKKDATCTEDGHKAYDTCSRCDFTTYTKIDALGHDYSTDWKTDVEPTCTTVGSKSHHCTRCEEKADVTELSAKGHTEVIDEAVAATCTEKGLTEGKHCSVCNTVLVEREEVPAKGHSWDDGKITTPATCETTGVKTYTCSNCQDTKTESIPALGHSYGEWTVTTPATCTEQGVETRVCANNAEHTETRSIAKAAHTHSAAVVENKVEATCTTAGSYDEVVYCSVCDTELSRETKTIEATGHNYGETGVCKTCGDKKLGSLSNPYTVAQALEVLKPLEKGQMTEKVYVSGIVKSIDEYGDYLKGIHLVDALTDADYLLVYTCSFTADVSSVYPNDAVVIAGYLQNYNGTLELGQKEKDYPTFEKQTVGTSTITVGEGSSEYATVTLAEKTAENGTMVTFTVTPQDGYEVISVKANDEDLTASDDAVTTYSLTVKGNMVIVVETQEIGAVAPESIVMLTFPAKEQVGCNGYTSQWTAKTENDQVFNIANFNNNNNGWTYIKLGSKSIKADTASIETSFTDKVVTKIVVNYVNNNNNKGTLKPIVLKITKNDVEVGIVTSSETSSGTNYVLTFNISNATAGCSYKLVFEYTSCTDNGFVTVNSVEYIGLGLTDADKVAMVKEELAAKAVEGLIANENFTLPTTAVDGVSLAWASDNTAIAIDGQNATVTMGENEVTVNVTATITCGKVTDTVTFKYTVPSNVCKHTETTKTEKVDATCLTEGNIEYWTCSSCKKLFSDEACTKEITEDQTVTAKTDHVYESESDYLCATCGLPKAGQYIYSLVHTTLDSVRYYALAEKSGNYLATTKDVDKAAIVTLAKVDGGYTIKIGDKYLGYVKSGNAYVVNLTGTVDSTNTWVWNADNKVMTISVSGTEYYLGTYSTYDTFSLSKISFIKNTGSFHCDFVPVCEGHSFDEGVTTTSATCAVAGVKVYTCSKCAGKKYEDIKKLAHTEVTDKAVAATCTETGLTEGKHCSVCEEVIVKQETIPALGHTDTDNDGKCDVCESAMPSGETTKEKEYKYTFTVKVFSANNTTVALGDVEWTLAGDGNYWGYDEAKGQQFGSSKNPYKSLTLTSAAFTKVKKIIINTSGASSINASFTVTVRGEKVGNTATSLKKDATDYTFELDTPLDGCVEFEFTQTSSKAIYIKSITVIYE